MLRGEEKAAINICGFTTLIKNRTEIQGNKIYMTEVLSTRIMGDLPTYLQVLAPKNMAL